MAKESHFLLVNPYIEGNPQIENSLPRIYRASSAEGAAKEAWKNMSKYFSGSLPAFHITLARASNGSYHHFKIKEQEKKGTIDYNIIPHVINVPPETLARFKQNLEDAKRKGMSFSKKMSSKKSKDEAHKGGGDKKRKDDSSDSDDSDDEDYYHYNRRKKILAEQPIVYFWYDPTIYGVEKVWYPSFISPLFPPVELALSYLPFTYLAKVP